MQVSAGNNAIWSLIWTHNYCIDVPEQRNRVENVITLKRGASPHPLDEVIWYISVFPAEITVSMMPLQGQRLWGGRGEPFPGSGPWSVQFGWRISVTDLSDQQTAGTQQNKCLTITAGKWKVLWGKHAALIHMAVWRPGWTQMSQNVDQMARSFIFSFYIFNSGAGVKWNSGFSK